MNPPSVRLRWWLAGLAIFAVVAGLGMWLAGASHFGIVDHQLAGDAETVDRIQADWRDSGVRWLAILSMAGDLLFIGTYSLGAWIAGRGFARSGNRLVRAIGWTVALAAVLFGFADYTETLLQFVQLLQERGVDRMAAIAAAMQMPKLLAWSATFLGVLAGLIVDRIWSRGA